MSTRTARNLTLASAALALPLAASVLTGCGVSSFSSAAPVKVAGAALQGSVHGGQQPVTGSTIQLYAANTTGYGASSFTLLNTAVQTSSNGSFSITGDYTCPSASSMVYITATGGNPGLTAGSNNPNLALLAPLGACGNLSAATTIQINELTTVAGVYAFSPFMSAIGQLSTSATNTQGLTNAFATTQNLVNTTTGQAPGASLPTGAVAPIALMNTLGDIIASCVNSAGGAAGSNTTCGRLFTATTVGSSVPTDTIGALLSIAKNPANNASTLLALSTASGPFQPTVSSASSFLLSLKYTSGISAPSALALDATGNVYITNAGTNTLSILGPTGANATGSPYATGSLNVPSGVALDAAGNAWVTNRGSSTLSVFTPAGVGTQTTATGLSAPTGIAIDGQGVLWVTNTGSNSVATVVVSGRTVSSVATYTNANITTPNVVAINPN